MKRIRDILAFFGRMDRGFYPVLVAAALLETLEGFGVLLISSTILNLLVAGAGPESILSATLVMTGGYGALHWLRLLAVRHKDYRQQRLRYRYWCFVVEHVFRLPYWYLEKEDFVETLEQIWQNDRTYDLTMGTLNQAYAMVRSGFSVLVACVSFLRLFGAVRGLGDSAFLVGMLILGLFVLILLSTGYIVWQRKRNAQDMVGFMEEVVKRNKVAMYLLGQVIANYPKGKHIRLYGMQEKLRREQRKQTAGFGHLIAHQGRMELKPCLAGDISSVAISAMVYLTVSAIAMAGGLGAGSIIWYAGVVQQLLESVRRLIGLASELYGNCTRQQVIFGLTEAVKEADSGARGLPSGEEHTLEFRDVSFAYPGSDRMVLEHVDLRISGRERVAQRQRQVHLDQADLPPVRACIGAHPAGRGGHPGDFPGGVHGLPVCGVPGLPDLRGHFGGEHRHGGRGGQGEGGEGHGGDGPAAERTGYAPAPRPGGGRRGGVRRGGTENRHRPCPVQGRAHGDLRRAHSLPGSPLGERNLWEIR